MRTLKFNGEFWYEDRTPLLERIATWIIWIGGWRVFRERPVFGRRKLSYLTPISLLGHRVTFFDWGAQVRVPSGDHLVVVWRSGHIDTPYVYVSADGTPSRAHTWLYGAPGAIERAAAMRVATSRGDAS